MTLHALRVLDASALVELFNGHRTLMRLMEDADSGGISLVVPTLAIAEAQAVMNARPAQWDFILAFRGIRTLPLSEHDAIAVGTAAAPALRAAPAARPVALIGPLMLAQVAHEARELGAVVVTGFPSVYAGFDVDVSGLESG
ncbi:hypothetical protein [Actinoplanes sp. URMC 104]|uniref:hypothetical protein n=1 Tax=Actinoplanes sp. URMC 104 TaxID=3423409 RepID=UPI003F1C9E1F